MENGVISPSPPVNITGNFTQAEPMNDYESNASYARSQNQKMEPKNIQKQIDNKRLLK